MKRFSEFLAEGNPLARLKHHIDTGREYAVFSAERGSNSKAENRAKMQALAQKLRERGYGFKKAKGIYKGGEENSIVVYAKNTGRDAGINLKRDVKDLGTQFHQDSIYQGHGKRGKLIGTNDNDYIRKGEVKDVGVIRYNRKRAPFQTAFNPSKPANQRPTFTTGKPARPKSQGSFAKFEARVRKLSA